MKKTSARGHTAKHSSSKHSATSKHSPKGKGRTATAHKTTVHTVAKKTKHAKARGLSLGDVQCCAAEAVAASLRIALSVPVSDEDVLGLYWHTADDADAGATILATLKAAGEHGLAGVRPRGFAPVGVLGDPWHLLDEGLPSLILGLSLPEGAHAIADDGFGWWSWGERLPMAAFPGAVIEEAWAVTW